MATVTVVRAMRRKVLGDKKSPLVNTLKRKSGTSLTYDIKRLANEIEGFGALSPPKMWSTLSNLLYAT